MLDRHSIRVKTMQQLYTYFQTGAKGIPEQKNNLESSLYEHYDAYIHVLFLIDKVNKYSEIDALQRSKKFLPTEEDLNVSTKLADSSIIRAILKSPAFVALKNFDKYKRLEDSTNLAKSVYKQVITKPEYENFCKDSVDSEQGEKKVLNLIADILLNQSPTAEEYFSMRYINWAQDKGYIKELVFKSIKKKCLIVEEKIDRNVAFGLELFERVATHWQDYDQIIAERAINWDLARMLAIDKILLRMCIAEFYNFPSIPKKASLDEYLEIAKNFSTEKSYKFINGLLHAILSTVAGRKE